MIVKSRRQLCSWTPCGGASATNPTLLDTVGADYVSIGENLLGQPRAISYEYLHQGIFPYPHEDLTVVGLSLAVKNPNLTGAAADALALEWMTSDYYAFYLSLIVFQARDVLGTQRISPIGWAIVVAQSNAPAPPSLVQVGGMYTAWSDAWRDSPTGNPAYGYEGAFQSEWLDDYAITAGDARFDLRYKIVPETGGAPDASLVQSWDWYGSALTLQTPIYHGEDQGGL